MKLIQTLLLLGFVTIAFGQEFSIQVDYELHEKIDPKTVTVNGVPESEVEAAQKRFAEEMMANILTYKLTATGNESQYEFVPKIDNNQDGTTWSYGDEGEILYLNTKEKISLKTEFYPKKLIVIDSLEHFDWQIHREKRNICGLKTMKATIQKGDTLQIEAWYAPELSFRVGPEKYHGLPGLILEITEKYNSEYEGDSSYTYTCSKIAILGELVKVERPSKGEFISPEELKKLWEEIEQKYREMEQEGVDTSD